MPEMDGYEAGRRIREDHPDIPLVLFSATMARDISELEGLGFDAFLPKPFDLDQLAELLDTYCERAVSNASVAAAVPQSQASRENASSHPGLSETVATNMRLLEERRPGAVSRIYKRCIDALPGAVDEVEKAWLNENAEHLRTAGHALKSLSSTAGSLQLAGIAAEIEAIGSNAVAGGETCAYDGEQVADLKTAATEAIVLLEGFAASFGPPSEAG